MKKCLTILLCGVLTLSLSCTALAAEYAGDTESAAAFLREQGIMIGDENGNMRLNEGLSRAELAVLLTRLHGGPELDPEPYLWACYFTDVPQWAKPYVGYCTAMLLVTGYEDQRYGARDPVTPAAACTVILRACGHADGEGTLWRYDTACDYTVHLGLLSRSATQDAVITRGDMAVLIYRALLAQGNPFTPGSEQEKDPELGEYTIDAEHWSREDFSAQANPAVFTGVYDRELYNAIRQTLVDAGRQDGQDYQYAYTMVSDEAYSAAVVNILGRIDGVFRYEHYVPSNFTKYYEYPDYFAVSAAMPDNYADAYGFIQPVIQEVQGLDTDSEKIAYLNSYLRSLMVYDSDATTGVTQVFSPHEGEVAGACSSYAKAFRFLCAAADIPCMSISTTTHIWNLVYADGAWQHVDVSANDLAGVDVILLIADRPQLTDQAPEATAFIKELLVPGSTK